MVWFQTWSVRLPGWSGLRPVLLDCLVSLVSDLVYTSLLLAWVAEVESEHSWSLVTVMAQSLVKATSPAQQSADTFLLTVTGMVF